MLITHLLHVKYCARHWPSSDEMDRLGPPMKLIAEHTKKPSGGFLKCLCTAPPAWVSLKLAVTVSWAQEVLEVEHQTASSASTRRLGSCEQPQKGVSLTGLILAPTPPPLPQLFLPTDTG